MKKEFDLWKKIQVVTDYSPCETSDPVFGIINRQDLDKILKEFINRIEEVMIRVRGGRQQLIQLRKLAGDKSVGGEDGC